MPQKGEKKAASHRPVPDRGSLSRGPFIVLMWQPAVSYWPWIVPNLDL